MGYYRGDGSNYYRGDYYRGDPFIGSLLKAGGKALIKGAKRTIGGIRNAGARAARKLMQRTPEMPPGFSTGVGVGIPIGMTIPQGPGTGVARRGPPLDHSDQEVEDAWRAGWRFVGNRRKMNPLNPKALRRALRRAEGFERFAQRTVNSLYRVIDGRRVRTFKKRSK